MEGCQHCSDRHPPTSSIYSAHKSQHSWLSVFYFSHPAHKIYYLCTGKFYILLQMKTCLEIPYWEIWLCHDFAKKLCHFLPNQVFPAIRRVWKHLPFVRGSCKTSHVQGRRYDKSTKPAAEKARLFFKLTFGHPIDASSFNNIVAEKRVQLGSAFTSRAISYFTADYFSRFFLGFSALA